MITINIIGVDCATQSKKTGLALGSFESGEARLETVVAGTTHKALVATVARWVQEADAALLALDAPLGWPEALGRTLMDHHAGDPIEVAPNTLFRRHTDRFVKEHVGCQPLDVGADRIARTAHAALRLLNDVGEIIGQPVTMGWAPPERSNVHAIEVYPAATLKMAGLPYRGYKGRGNEAQRGTILGGLAQWMTMPDEQALMMQYDDVLDAAVCVLAGADFLRCDTHPPDKPDLARREGWIWVRRTKDNP
jgi:predicted RNase H-like nuclease